MAARKSAEEMQAEILEVELETKRLALEEQREKNEEYTAKKAARKRNNAVRQAELKKEAANNAAIIHSCNHRQGGSPDNMLKGNGPSSIMRSRVMFSNNWVLQCLRCPLQMARPHPNLRKTDPQKYEADLAEYERLLEMSKTNNLPPVEGPAFEFTNADGVAIIPALR
jgi:hypothetical protein